jgi:hypothetical protein
MLEPCKSFLQDISPALIGFVGVFVGFIPTVLISFLQKIATQLDQVATALSEFYAAAASVYYGKYEIQKARKDSAADDSPRMLNLYEIYDTHYQEFLAASTKLAAKVPPKLRPTILAIEDLWDKILKQPLDKEAKTEWFKKLDDIRQKVFDSIAYYPRFEWLWKHE